MAIYHLHAKLIKRSLGQSAVASAAYRSGEKLKDERLDHTHDFTRKENVVHSEIMLPENSPQKFVDRQTLWNEVEKIEKRKDAQLAREVEFSLPTELPLEKNIALAKNFLQENFMKKGMVVDFSLHMKEGNPHCHAMMSLREMTKDGLAAKKNRAWNDKKLLKDWRKNWEVCCNQELKRNGFSAQISCETLEAQGIDRIPTIHEGVWHTVENKKINAAIKEANAELMATKNEIESLEKTKNEIIKGIEKAEQQEKIADKPVRSPQDIDIHELNKVLTKPNIEQKKTEKPSAQPQKKHNPIYDSEEYKRLSKNLKEHTTNIENLENSIKENKDKLVKLEKREKYIRAEMKKFEEQGGIVGFLKKAVYDLEPAKKELREIKKEKEKTELRIKVDTDTLASEKQNKKTTEMFIKDLLEGKGIYRPKTYTDTEIPTQTWTQTQTKTRTKSKAQVRSKGFDR